jgi:hypothetical protein
MQDLVYSVSPANHLQTLPSLAQGDWHGLNAPYLWNAVLSAVIARPHHCELYAEMISELWEFDPGFPGGIQRGIIRHVEDAAIQFLTVLLLDKGLITPDFILSRLICGARPVLSPELSFYFFPEYVARVDFFVRHLLPRRKRLAAWDLKYSAQSHLPLSGRDLGENDFQQFKEFRLKGKNHNPICIAIEANDHVSLETILKEGRFTVDSEVPKSLFSRFNEDKFNGIRLVEYAAMFGSWECFRLLKSAGATLPQDLMGYAICGANPEILQACTDNMLPYDPMIVRGLRSYHFSAIKIAHESRGCPITRISLLDMLRHKFKGLLYLVTKPDSFAKLLEDLDDLSPETFVLMESAQVNDPFVTRLITEMNDVDIMEESQKQPFPTALHAATAANAVDSLELLLASPKVDVNADGRCGTPLFVAAKYNAVEAIHLLGAVANINVNQVCFDVRFCD